jgi:hypothetical protein
MKKNLHENLVALSPLNCDGCTVGTLTVAWLAPRQEGWGGVIKTRDPELDSDRYSA